MLVRIDKDWDEPDILRQSPAGLGTWGDLHFTTEPVRDCDLLVVLNSPARDIHVRCPAGNKWLFTQESPIEKYRWHTDSFKYFDKIFTYWDDAANPCIIHDQTALPWHLGKTYDELLGIKSNEAVARKENAVSWVTSNATHKDGHKLRMAFKDYMLSEDFKFHLFGRGFDPIADKFDAIFPYRYSIAIENYTCNDYWTEKIADCFLAWTVPIYWGAKNILSYFPQNSMILIDPNEPETSLRKIRTAIENDHFNTHIDAIAEARELVLKKYQFFPHMAHLAAKYDPAANRTVRRHFIPTNPEHYKRENNFYSFKLAVKRCLSLALMTSRL